MGIITASIAQQTSALLVWKPPVRLVATTNQSLSGLPVIDGVQTVTDDEVLLTGQTNGALNGPYKLASNGWLRRYDFDTSPEAILGSTWKVTEGSAKAGTTWSLRAPTGPLVLNTSLLTISEDAGDVVSVGATAPITSTGGTTPTIGISAASGGAAGSMSAAHYSKLDALATINTVAAPLTLGAGTLDITQAGAAAEGSMSAAHYNDLNDATSSATASKLAKRDGSGACSFGFIGIGTNPAGAGAVRLANVGKIVSRNAANNADVDIIWVDSGNVINLGDETDGADIRFRPKDGSKVLISRSGVDEIQLYVDANVSAFVAPTKRVFIGATANKIQLQPNSTVEVLKSAIGTGQTVGLDIINTTAATGGATQQHSPLSRLAGSAWLSEGSAKAVEWATQARAVTGSPVHTEFAIYSQIDGGGWVERLMLSTDGTVKFGSKFLDLYTVTAVKTNNYSANFGELVRCDPSGGAFTVTLPSASANAGRGVTVKNVTSSTVGIDVVGPGAEVIDAADPYSILAAYGTATFVSDGTNWMAFPAES